MPSTLPSQRDIVTTLISSLSTTTASTPPPSPSLPPSPDLHARRQLLLTLHVIFPQMLLPALDLIDRRLITRLTLTTSDASSTTKTVGGLDATKLFVVQSLTPASTHPNARSHRATAAAATRKNYIVRLTAWNCTCANFAFDAFPTKAPATTVEIGQKPEQIETGAFFGGVCLDGADAVPCCKHLLACLLVQRGGRHFADSMEDREVTREELADIVANS